MADLPRAPSAPVWLDGELVPPERAVVSAFDHGYTVGDGVFEALKAVDGVPFAVRRHLERLRASADGMGLPVPVTDDELRDAIDQVLSLSTFEVARVRITLSAGAAPLGTARGEGRPTLVVAAGPMAAREPSVAVATVPWPRNERSAVAGLKTISYAENVVALAHAHERGASEALVPTTDGRLCEGTGSNVFVVVEGRLVTPTLSTGCLPGVTRALVLECTDAEEDDLPVEALADASEVFLTSTSREVQPVHVLDDRALPSPGPRTEEAMAAFAALVAGDTDP